MKHNFTCIKKSKSNDCFISTKCEGKESLLWWQKKACHIRQADTEKDTYQQNGIFRRKMAKNLLPYFLKFWHVLYHAAERLRRFYV